MLASGSFNLLGFVVQLPLLTIITIPIARRIARHDRDPTQFWFVMAAFAAKMLGALARYYFTYIAYVSVGDAEEYDAFGRYLAPYYRSFDFSPDVGQVPGTGFLKAVTGDPLLHRRLVEARRLRGVLVAGVHRAAPVLARLQARGPVRRLAAATASSCCSCRRCSTGRRRSARTRGRSWASASAPTAWLGS